MKNKFKIISYIKYPDGTYDAVGKFPLKQGDFSTIVEYYNKCVGKYCEMHDYAFEFRELQDTDLQDIQDALSDDWYLMDGSTKGKSNKLIDSIVLYKIKYLYEVLKRSEDEYVVFFDVDAIPSNPNIKLESFIDDTHEFFVSPGNKYADYNSAMHGFLPVLSDFFINKNNLLTDFLTSPVELVKRVQNEKNVNLITKFEQFVKIFAGFNEGFIIVKNTDKMKKLFQLCCENFHMSLHRNFDSGSDGHVLSYFLLSNYFYSSLKFIDYNAMGHHLGMGPYKYNEETHFLLHDSDIINMENRTKLFKIMMNNKWWKPILGNKKNKNYLIIMKLSTLQSDYKKQLNKFINANKNKNIFISVEYFYIQPVLAKFHQTTKLPKNCKFWTNENIDKVIYI